MKPVVRNLARILLAVVVLAVAAVLLGFVPFPAGFIRAPVESAVRDATGLDLSIDGPITLRLGLMPEATTGDLVLGDPTGGPLLEVDFLQARSGLFALLGGRVHLRHLSANGIRVDYCSPMPTFSDDSDDDTTPPSVAVDAIELDRMTVRCGPPAQKDKLQIVIPRLHGSAPASGSMHMEADGSVSGIDFTLTATGGELDAFLAGPESFPLQLLLDSGATSVSVSGSLLTPLEEPAVDAEIATHSSDLQSLANAFDVSLPALGALRAQGRIRADVESMEFVEFTGALGNTHASLDTTVDLSGERTHIELTAVLDQLDLAPFLDNSPAANHRDKAPEQTDFDLQPVLDVLDDFDAEVQLTVRRVLGASLEAGAIELAGNLTDGVVEIQPLVADLLGSRVSIAASFDSQSQCPELKLSASGGGLDLTTLSPWLDLDAPLGGRIDTVNLESSSCGTNLLRHRDSLRAEIGITGGRMSLGDESFPLAADSVQLNIEPGERSRARLVGKLADEPINVTLVTGSLNALLGPDTWPINLDARGAGGRLKLGGRAGVANGNAVLDALVEFDAPRIGTLHSWTTVSPEATTPLRVETRLRIDESTVVAEAMALSLGRSDLGGSAVWHYEDDPDTLALTLRSSYLDLAEIDAVFPAATVETDPAGVADDDTQPVPARFTLPPVDLDVKFDAVNGGRLELQELDVSGRLRQGLINDGRVIVTIEDDVLLRGSLDLDLRHSPAEGALNVAAENVDVGRLLSKLGIADDLRLQADGLELAVSAEGDTLMQFLLNASLEADLRGFYWYIPEDDEAPGEELRKAFDLSLSELRLTAGPDQLATWAASGRTDDVPLELWMETPSLSDMLRDAAELPLTLVVAAGNNVAKLEARIDRSAEERFLAHVLVSGQVVESAGRDLAQLQSLLADYELRTDIILTDDEFTLPDIQMRLGDSTANGSFVIPRGGGRQRFDLMLHASHLQTDDLLYWSRDFPDAIDAEDQLADEKIASDADEAQRGFFLLVNDYISRFSESNDINVSIIVDDLRSGTDQLGDAELGLFVDDDEFILSPVKIHLPGGDVDAEYTLKVSDGHYNGSLKVHIQALRYGGLLRLVDDESEARGVLYLDTELSADTEWSPDLVPFDLLLNNADGSFSLAAWPENAEAGLLDLWSANLLLALLTGGASEEPSLMNCFVARLEVEDGVMETGTMLLDSTDTIIRGRGKIDLKEDQLELLVAPQAKREKFLSMSTPVMVTGPFDDFEIGIKPGGLFGMAMKWWMSLIYVPFKWLTGDPFPADGASTCFKAMDWDLTPEMHEYFLQRDFSVPPPIHDD